MGPDEPFSSSPKRALHRRTKADAVEHRLFSERVLIVAAHPDDEIIGAGAQLPQFSGGVDVLHVTNGSPDRLGDAQRAGLSTREEYAEARHREMLLAVALGNVPQESCHQIGLTDQRASLGLPDLTCKLVGFINRLRPALILTHPYEGGHPDHDACAFAVHAAVTLNLGPGAEIWEFTSYHAGQNGVETGVFLPPRERVVEFQLTPEQQALKREMFDCFRTQQHVLRIFGTETEAFRPAPEYDFRQPPHPGRLHYEQFDWGITAVRWRQLAADALQQMGLEPDATHSS